MSSAPCTPFTTASSSPRRLPRNCARGGISLVRSRPQETRAGTNHREGRPMRRVLVGSVLAAALIGLALLPSAARATTLDCDEPTSLCTEALDSFGYDGEYIGHDEPSLLFYSNTPGSGNSNFYRLRLPTDPQVMPNQSGTAGTWNFQLHPAFWLGMALCDNQSAPEFTHAPCTPDSDTNIFDR